MAKTAAKGTIDNPYSMSECEKMLDAGTWPGGYVRDDAGTVSYVMKSVTVQGYSGSGSGSDWHGSDYEFCTGSYEWHEPDTDEKGCEDDKKDLPTGNEGGTGIGGNTGGGTGGGGGYHPATPNANDGKNGSFLYGATYYTEKQYNQMCKSGTWTGGNIYTLGYVGRDCIISPCLTSIDANDSCLSVFKEKSSAICKSLEKLGKEIMSLAYVQAIARYNSATGSPLYFDTKSLGIDDLRGCTCKHNEKTNKITGINFLDVQNLQALLKDKSLPEQAVVLSTAMTLGNVSFERVSDGVYTIKKDEYDFGMHNWSEEPVRNISTLIGFTVSEGASVVADAATLNVFAPLVVRYMDIVTGMVRRHVLGQTSFYIYISGTVKVDEKK